MKNKGGFTTPLAMLFAVGVGMYIITIGISLNNASYKVVQHTNLSKFTQVINFFNETNSLLDVDAPPCDGCEEITITNKEAGELLHNGLKQSGIRHLKRINPDGENKSNTINVFPGATITIPEIDGGRKQFSQFFITFNKKSSCMNSLLSVDQYKILGYASGKNEFPEAIVVEDGFESENDWVAYRNPDETDGVKTVVELCSLINNNLLWVHYGV